MEIPVLGRLDGVAGVRREVHEAARLQDTALFADNAVSLAAQRERHQLVGMVVQLRPGTGALGDLAKIQVLALDHRPVRGREMRVKTVRLHSLKSEKRHSVSQ